MLTIFDTHAHFHDEQFDADREELLFGMHTGFDPERSGEEKRYRIGTVIDVAAEKDSLDAVLSMTQRYEFVYGAIGLHPDEIADLDPETEEKIRALLNEPKIVAVGEIGLDYYWNKEARDVQIAGFRKQIGIAKEFGLPIIVHSREAAEDTMNVIREEAASLREAVARKRNAAPEAVSPGIIHCYSYSVEHARMYADMGFFLGIGGVVTYKNAKKLKEVVREIPLSRLVLETDSPYLSAVPNRGKRNDSRNLVYVAREIASLKNISEEEVIRRTAANAEELFKT